ncbi:MAG: hypothetical protein K2L12_02730 [Clostridia bacterium]|nr:hypothetical protein [Clostridia bacterium]
MKISLKGKGLFKTIALALAGVAALGLIAWGIKALVDYTKNDLKKVTLSYDVGNLGADGKYVNDESTLYTKEAFGCYGLQVKPDFDSTVNYQIFYYDILDNYISSTEVLTDGYSGKAPVNGAYARIVIEPRDDEDGKISLTERVKYPMQLTVKVKKNQDINGRFTSYKGKLMEVVADTDSLVFTPGLCLISSTLDWDTGNQYAATSTTCLKVVGGSTIKRNFSKLSEGYSSATCVVFEFKDLPSADSYISSKSVTETGLVLNKQTKCIIICCESSERGSPWSATDISKLPSCFTITK